MHFDFVDLKLFVHLASTNNLTRAAERSNLGVSAASARIRNLEVNVGSQLLKRHNLGVTLTQQGETFLDHARQLLQQSEMLRGDMMEYAHGKKASIKIFANANASSAFLPDLLRRFLRDNPFVSVELEECISHEVVKAVLSGAADVGIVSSRLHTANLDVVPYHRDPIVAAISKQHPLASRKTLAFEDLLDCDFVAVPGTRVIGALLRQEDINVGRRMKIRVHGGSYETVCNLIDANVGISVMPESAALRHAKTLAIAVIPLTDEWAATDLQICVRSLNMLPKAARDLIDLMARDAQFSDAYDDINLARHTQ